MNRKLILIGMVGLVSLFAGCGETRVSGTGTTAAPGGASEPSRGASAPAKTGTSVNDSSIKPAKGGPEVIIPCGACTYSVSNKTLSGTLDPAFNGGYAISSMTLTLLDASGSIMQTITTLTPSGGSGNTNIGQTVGARYTTGIDKVKLSWLNSAGAPGWQFITMTP